MATEMPLLLVDDRDGRIVAELESEDDAVRVLAAMARDDPRVPEYLWLVDCRSSHGSVFATDSSVAIRALR